MDERERFSPAQIRQQQFATGWRGLNAAEVTALLNGVADCYAR
jgi:DivIVA domain-containing protein